MLRNVYLTIVRYILQISGIFYKVCIFLTSLARYCKINSGAKLKISIKRLIGNVKNVVFKINV